MPASPARGHDLRRIVREPLDGAPGNPLPSSFREGLGYRTNSGDGRPDGPARSHATGPSSPAKGRIDQAAVFATHGLKEPLPGTDQGCSAKRCGPRDGEGWHRHCDVPDHIPGHACARIAQGCVALLGGINVLLGDCANELPDAPNRVGHALADAGTELVHARHPIGRVDGLRPIRRFLGCLARAAHLANLSGQCTRSLNVPGFVGVDKGGAELV
jgi:hypothetical protein